jgi:hypothetical protein
MTRISATLDDWTGPTSKNLEFSDVTFSQIGGLIERLDATRCTLLNLRTTEGRTLTIGGGRNKFVVCQGDREGYSLTLAMGSKTEKESVYLYCGGQLADFPPIHICTTSDALRAVASVLFGEEDHQLIWELS